MEFIKSRQTAIDEEIKALEECKMKLEDLVKKLIAAETAIQFALSLADECGVISDSQAFLSKAIEGIDFSANRETLKDIEAKTNTSNTDIDTTNNAQSLSQSSADSSYQKNESDEQGKTLTTRQMLDIKKGVKSALGFEENAKPRKAQIHDALVDKAKCTEYSKIIERNDDSEAYWIAAKDLCDEIAQINTNNVIVEQDASCSTNYTYTTIESANPFKMGDIVRHKENGEIYTVDTLWLPIHGGSVGVRMASGLRNAVPCIKLELLQSVDAVEAVQQGDMTIVQIQEPNESSAEVSQEIEAGNESTEMLVGREIYNDEIQEFTLEQLIEWKQCLIDMEITPEADPQGFDEVEFLIKKRMEERGITDLSQVDLSEHYEVSEESLGVMTASTDDW